MFVQFLTPLTLSTNVSLRKGLLQTSQTECLEKSFQKIKSNLSRFCCHCLDDIHMHKHKNNYHAHWHIFVGTRELLSCTHRGLKQSINMKTWRKNNHIIDIKVLPAFRTVQSLLRYVNGIILNFRGRVCSNFQKIEPLFYSFCVIYICFLLDALFQRVSGGEKDQFYSSQTLILHEKKLRHQPINNCEFLRCTCGV